MNIEQLHAAIASGKLNDAVELTKMAIEQKMEPSQVINKYMIPAMEEVGARFEAGKAFVPELLMAARAMKGSLDLLKPLMAGSATSSILGRVVIGTVQGDLHDIGKNLVASMLEGCGFEVINLGTDVSAEKFVASVKEHNANILCMSALLTTTMAYMKTVVEVLEAEGLRGKVKVMVGGAPINDKFAASVGADGYSANANAAVVLAKSLLS